MRRAAAFSAAVFTAYFLGAIASTQFILSNVASMGLPVSFANRLSASAHDLIGMATSYLPLIATGFLIAFAITMGILKFLPNLRTTGYVLGGAVAVLALLLIMQSLFGMHPLPATRTTAGLIAQVLAGAAGGYIFVVLTRAPTARN